uniref:Transmembrane protein 53 n=1 Tax=Ascaris lumbricoides TaxID=6252 RepID=A0A0M3I534_ASCLU
MAFGSVACKCVVTRPTLTSNNYSNLIVVLIGWAGCKDSYLAKYSAIYERRGITTLRYTVRITNRAMRHAHVPARFTLPMVDALNELIASPARKILFHFFSMNSIFALSSLLASCGPTLMDRAVAAVFDSTPAKYATTFGTVLDFTLPQQFPSAGPLMLAAIKYIVLRLNDINEYKNSILSTIDGKPERREIFYWAARCANLPKLQLYIYSRKDAACPHESIRAFCEEQISKRGAKAFTMFCEDSEHVQHLRRYPDLYISTVNEFLDRVISQ